MATPVYAWPPVGAMAREWDVSEPISESFSALTGRRYASAIKPKRRVAQVVVSGMSCDHNGAGYILMLKQLLEGGANLVRLSSFALDRYLSTEARNALRQAFPLLWEDGSADLDWTFDGVEGHWLEGAIITGTISTSGGFHYITVSGLPANTLVARPGDHITVFEDESDTTGSTAQVLAPATTNGSGIALIRLFSALAYSGRANIGVPVSAVFRVVGELPRATIPRVGDWTYGWQFEEVFSDEVDGFTEIDGWWEPT